MLLLRELLDDDDLMDLRGNASRLAPLILIDTPLSHIMISTSRPSSLAIQKDVDGEAMVVVILVGSYQVIYGYTRYLTQA